MRMYCVIRGEWAAPWMSFCIVFFAGRPVNFIPVVCVSTCNSMLSRKKKKKKEMKSLRLNKVGKERLRSGSWLRG